MKYVYIYLDPRKSPLEPIYVGQGCGKRMVHHLDPSKCSNSILRRKLNKIQSAGLSPIIQQYAINLTKEEADKIEKELILKYGRIHLKTGTLCNFTEGGEGTLGFKHHPDTKQLFSEQRKGKKQTEKQYQANMNRIYKDLEASKARYSAASKGHSRHSEKQMEILKCQEYRANSFEVTLPNGEIKQIKNLSKFCKENEIDRTSATKSATSGIPYKGFSFKRL